MSTFEILAKATPDNNEAGYGTESADNARDVMANILNDLDGYHIAADTDEITVADVAEELPTVSAFNVGNGNWEVHEYDGGWDDVILLGAMTFAEAKAIRNEIVDGIRKEWKKTKSNPWDMAANAIPNSRSAKLYWKARNASQGVMRNLANEREDFNAAHVGEGYETHTPDNYKLTDEQEHVMRCALANYRKACELCEE